jgi:hypothetical protein
MLTIVISIMRFTSVGLIVSYTSSLPSCLAHTTGAQPSRAEPTEFAHLLILSPLCLSIAESIRTVSRACVSA